MTVPFSTRVRCRLALIEPALSAAAVRIIEHPKARELFPYYMRSMHGISRAAVPLLEAALEATNLLPDDDAAASDLRHYLRTHIPEERGHDEWILEDLQVIGFDRDAVLTILPSPTIVELVGAQYYWLRHSHPVALMGYLAVMEANPPSLEAVERLRAATGFPAEAFRSMRVHARLDLRHKQDLYVALDALQLTPSQERLISLNAMRTAARLSDVLIELVDTFDAEPEPAVAVAVVRAQ